ncbi:MAG: CSLREA domain-containing protein [Acidobacteriota bacterium]
MIPTQSRSTARVAVLLAACALPLIYCAPANAATITVTTTADVIAVDGLCSLREAVTAANTNLPFSDCPTGEAVPAIDVIELAAGTYTLTLLPVDEDANLGGDLDLTEAVTVRGLGEDFIWWDDPATPDVEPLDVFNDPTGFPRTFTDADLPDVVIEMGIGDAATLGDGDRVFDIPAPPPGSLRGRGGDIFRYTFENLGIVGGDAFCEVTPPGSFCQAGAGGINAVSLDALTLHRVALFENSASCSGPCGTINNGAALYAEDASDLRVFESVVASNVASCAGEPCSTGAIVLHLTGLDSPRSEISHTLVADNLVSCSTEDCRAGEVINLRGIEQRIQQTVVTGNEMDCSMDGADCSVGALMKIGFFIPPVCVDSSCLLQVQDVELSENQNTCEGFECVTSPLLLGLAAFDQTLERIRIARNVRQCTGGDCDLGGVVDVRALGPLFGGPPPGGSLTLQTLELIDNTYQCDGPGCIASSILRVGGQGLATLTDVSITGESSCMGAECSVASPVLLDRPASIQGLSVTDTNVSCLGDSCELDPLVSVLAMDADAPALGGLVLATNDVSCSSPGCGFGSGTNPGHVGEGGILALATLSSEAPLAAIDQSTITGNTTSARGILASNLDLEIKSSTISTNASALDGGAIFNGWVPDPEMPDAIAPGTLTLRDTAVLGNEAGQGPADGRGGAIFNPEGAILRLIGASIDNNTATDGGGIWNEGAIPFRQASSIAGNAPNDCVNSGAGTGCGILFSDDFESGDTSSWSQTTP